MADNERKPGDPEIPINPDDVVLYHGPLQELNGRNPRRQFDFADKEWFISSWYRYTDRRLPEVREELAKMGLIGLVNARTFIEEEHNLDRFYYVEGTPIEGERPKIRKNV